MPQSSSPFTPSQTSACNICFQDIDVAEFDTSLNANIRCGLTDDKRHVRLGCGHAFCRECTGGLLEHGPSKCPTCRTPISKRQINSLNAQLGTSYVQKGVEALRPTRSEYTQSNTERDLQNDMTNEALWSCDLAHHQTPAQRHRNRTNNSNSFFTPFEQQHTHPTFESFFFGSSFFSQPRIIPFFSFEPTACYVEPAIEPVMREKAKVEYDTNGFYESDSAESTFDYLTVDSISSDYIWTDERETSLLPSRYPASPCRPTDKNQSLSDLTSLFATIALFMQFQSVRSQMQYLLPHTYSAGIPDQSYLPQRNFGLFELF